jgi:hypothetical protein
MEEEAELLLPAETRRPGSKQMFFISGLEESVSGESSISPPGDVNPELEKEPFDTSWFALCLMTDSMVGEVD